eukprot:TRINITY_DN8109_c0_g1_i6.p1 TRINITY_DN8109_c0_g1~~TRINITY_DN8109_c0_g1_i6.p1  ORF type:complete len:423 (-),score=104.42 TRINITY_DN8109_c0_g1_i6:244-1512(-)
MNIPMGNPVLLDCENKKTSSHLLSEQGSCHRQQNQKINEIVVEVKATDGGEVALDLSYIVTGASWVPSYDARVTSESDVVEVSYYGNITNSSGEDWKEVALHLSTATPSVAGKPPTLYGLTVDLKNQVTTVPSSSGSNLSNSAPLEGVTQSQLRRQRQPQVAIHAVPPSSSSPGNPRPKRKQPQVNVALYSIPDDNSNEDMLVEEVSSMALEGITSTSFTIQRKVTINSDGKPHKVTIQKVPLRARFSYTIIPSLVTSAYLNAGVKNETRDIPLLPGNMNVFLDGNFVAKSAIDLINPGETYTIYLGVEPSIKVNYICTKNLTDVQGIFNKVNRLSVEYVTTVKNMKDKDMDLTLFLRYPKSENGEVKVALKEPVLGDENSDISLTKVNNIQWKASMKAGQEKHYTFSYAIDYPLDKELSYL